MAAASELTALRRCQYRQVSVVFYAVELSCNCCSVICCCRMVVLLPVCLSLHWGRKKVMWLVEVVEVKIESGHNKGLCHLWDACKRVDKPVYMIIHIIQQRRITDNETIIDAACRNITTLLAGACAVATDAPEACAVDGRGAQRQHPFRHALQLPGLGVLLRVSRLFHSARTAGGVCVQPCAAVIAQN